MYIKQILKGLLMTELLQIISSSVATIDQRCNGQQFFSCSVETSSVSLMCDNTTFTILPDKVSFEPYSSQFYYEPRDSFIVLFNFSCIQSLTKDKVEAYSNINILNLRDNFIKILSKNSLGKSKTLKELYLSRNRISKIGPGTFKNLKNLLHLHLDHNQLTRVPARTFNSLSKLKVLKLDHNQLKKVPRTLFRGLISLEELDLSGNNLEEFFPVHLGGLTKLKNLNLENNNLKYFDAGNALLASSDLKSLNLNDNLISCFDGNDFSGHELSSLKITNNPLKTPKKEWISYQQSEPHPAVEISANGSWVCDCKAYSYMKYLHYLKEEEHEYLLSRLDIVCYNPSGLRGEKLSELSWEELEAFSGCSDPDNLDPCSYSNKIAKTIVTTTRTTQTKTNNLLMERITSTNPFSDRPIQNIQTTSLSNPSSSFKNKSIQFVQSSVFIIVIAIFILFIIAIIVFVIVKASLNKKYENCCPHSQPVKTKRHPRTNTESTMLSDNKDPLSEGVPDYQSSLSNSFDSYDCESNETAVKSPFNPQHESGEFDRVSDPNYESVRSASSRQSDIVQVYPTTNFRGTSYPHSLNPINSTKPPSHRIFPSVIPGYSNTQT